MKILFAALVVIHGLLHLLGPAKAFGFAELPQLTQPISKSKALLWLLAAVLLFATAMLLFTWPRGWWIAGAVAVVVSQIAIGSSWSDAKFGTVANGLVLLGVVYGFFSQGPTSFQADFERSRDAAIPSAAMADLLTEGDLASLPLLVQKYLRFTGAVGQPRTTSFRARFHGEIRSDPSSPWMPFTAEQWSAIDPPVRLFWMKATRRGIPIEAFHRFVGPHATMRVRLVSLVPIVDARGPEMDTAETVTLLNDFCFFAPDALLNPKIRWQEIDAHTVRATWNHLGRTVHADLSFAESGELVDFRSDDRSRSASDGQSFEPKRWSTPVTRYQTFGPRRLFAEGDALWHPKSGPFSYIHFVVDEITFNGQP